MILLDGIARDVRCTIRGGEKSEEDVSQRITLGRCFLSDFAIMGRMVGRNGADVRNGNGIDQPRQFEAEQRLEIDMYPSKPSTLLFALASTLYSTV